MLFGQRFQRNWVSIQKAKGECKGRFWRCPQFQMTPLCLGTVCKSSKGSKYLISLIPHISWTDLQTSSARPQLRHEYWWILEVSYLKVRSQGQEVESAWFLLRASMYAALKQWAEFRLRQHERDHPLLLQSSRVTEWEISTASILLHCGSQTFFSYD